MVRKPKTDAAQAPKKFLVAGSDPILASRFSAKIPSGFGGRSRPQEVRLVGEPPDHPASAFCQFLSEQTDAAHTRNPGPSKENPCLY